MRARLAAVAAAVALASAPESPASTQEAPPVAPVARLGVAELQASTFAPGGGLPLAVVDGHPIGADELLRPLFLTQTELVFAALEQSIRRRLLIVEGSRLGVGVSDELLSRRVAEVLAAQAAEFELMAGAGRDLAAFLEQRYGATVEVYGAAVRGQVLEDMLLARVIRYDARQSPRVQVRILVVDDLALAQEIQGKLAEGANFAALARQHSVDRSGKEGGLFPPVAEDCPHPLLAGVGALEPGQTAQVTAIEKDGVKLFRLLRLERRLPADPRPWPELAEEIEAELAAEPIDPFEVLEWDRRVRARHAVEVRLGRA